MGPQICPYIKLDLECNATLKFKGTPQGLNLYSALDLLIIVHFKLSDA